MDQAAKQILIVDDDRDHVRILEKRLRAAGYETMVSHDGADGLGQAVHRRPDLIIADVLLPKMNGFQMVGRLKSNPETSTIPVIMMSAVYVTEDDMVRAFELGAESYVAKADLALRKPLQEKVLLEAVASLLATRTQGEPATAQVLIVDDEPDTLRLISKRLAGGEFRLDTAADGQEALDKALATLPDLVLLDIKLPRVDGLTVLSQIKIKHPEIAVVMMTAYGSEEIAAEALKRGADDYLIKPLDDSEPLPTVRINLEKIQRRRELEQVAGELRQAASPDLEDKERLIDELRLASITLMEKYNHLLAAEEQNRSYAERLEQMVSERTREVERRSRELVSLHSVLSAAARSMNLQDIFDVALGELEELLGLKGAAAFLTEQNSKRLWLITQRHIPEEFIRWVSAVPGGQGVFAQAMATGRGKLITDLQRDEALTAAAQAMPEGHSLITFPIKSPTQDVGLIVGINPQRIMDKRSWQLLDTIGEELGVVVENVRLFDNLRQAYLSTIRALAEAVDAKDSYARGHSERVSAFATAIAEHLEMSQEFVDGLRNAGYLHDVGKIGIPEALLGKKGMLTREEMDIIRLHPGASHKILEQAHIPDEIKLMIRHHHERFDGSGYPDGLNGEDIPLGSRILSVADAFEAMVSERPYRLGLSENEALAELKRLSGSQFDPQIVQAFLQVKHEIDRASTGKAAGF